MNRTIVMGYWKTPLLGAIDTRYSMSDILQQVTWHSPWAAH